MTLPSLDPGLVGDPRLFVTLRGRGKASERYPHSTADRVRGSAISAGDPDASRGIPN